MVTVHGVISKDSKENHIYFLPCDRYKVLDHGCTIPTKLMRIQETIKNKAFDEGKHKNITLNQHITVNMEELPLVRKNVSALVYVQRLVDV